MVYIGKLEDEIVFQRKGSDEEPIEYVCLEGEQFHITVSFSCFLIYFLLAQRKNLDNLYIKYFEINV